MDTSTFCFATDLADEGVDTVLGNVQERGGIGGVTVAAAYYRPAIPDCDSADNLRAKVELARVRGLARVDFYHYGLMRLDALDLVREALSVRPAKAPV